MFELLQLLQTELVEMLVVFQVQLHKMYQLEVQQLMPYLRLLVQLLCVSVQQQYCQVLQQLMDQHLGFQQVQGWQLYQLEL